jgi:SAM-dependent methyltransferase
MESYKNSFDHIATYYEDLIRKYGHDPRACDYGRIESQAIKFRVLSEATNLTGKSVLDVGCGFADYFRYLSGNFADITYVGLDITPGMIVEAKKLEPALDLRCANILEWDSAESFDVVTANGIFYLIKDDPDKKMQDIIHAMFKRAKTVVAFNSLSSWASDQEAAEFYADPIETLAFCKTLTPWVSLRHDYHSRDFTIYMYKNRNA